MSDLEKAKRILEESGCTCVFVYGEKELVSNKRGIAPLLEYIENGEDLKCFSAADKVVGKAAALLYAYLGIKCVYAQILSRYAEEVFIKNGIPFEYGTITEKIINRRGDGLCPMEQAVLNIDDPATAIPLLKRKLEEIKK